MCMYIVDVSCRMCECARSPSVLCVSIFGKSLSAWPSVVRRMNGSASVQQRACLQTENVAASAATGRGRGASDKCIFARTSFVHLCRQSFSPTPSVTATATHSDITCNVARQRRKLNTVEMLTGVSIVQKYVHNPMQDFCMTKISENIVKTEV